MTDIQTVGILADSHDNMVALKKAVELFIERNVDLVIHAGDLVAPFTAKELNRLQCPLVMTFGNNDGELLGLNTAFAGNIFQPPHIIEVNDKQVLILHDPILLDELQQHNVYDVIIYGHLHQIDVRHGKPLIISPGECGGWLTGNSTVAIWNSESDNVDIIEL